MAVGKCGGCKYWDRNKAWGEGKDKAACRVNPPTIRPSGMSCYESGEWPSTNKNDWCGRFAAMAAE